MSGQVVTATAFVRNFGAYARSAGSEPIHILNHGRPAWSLITTDYLNSLTRGKPHSADDHSLEHFVDAVTVNVIITDADLRVIRTNPPARHALQMTTQALHLMPLAEALFDYKLIVQGAERVLRTGVPEDMDVDMSNSSLRTFRVRIERFGDGIAILGEETTTQVIAREKDARASAYETLIDALPGLARGTINGRGLIVHATAHLADLVQSSADRVEGMRLSVLFHHSSRPAVTEAIERLLSDRKEFTMPAQLQADGLQSIPVSFTAIPTLSNLNDERAIFLLSQRPI